MQHYLTLSLLIIISRSSRQFGDVDSMVFSNSPLESRPIVRPVTDNPSRTLPSKLHTPKPLLKSEFAVKQIAKSPVAVSTVDR